MKQAVKHIHFVGIGGAGMSGIAEILHTQGYRVTGSDLSASAVTERLHSLGLTVHIGHAAAHIAGAQAVVTSSAIQAHNPEVLAARAAAVPVLARAVLLAELLRHKQGIAVAGTHGKTTTTSLVTSVLIEAGVDPSYVIGGQLLAVGANAHAGKGEHIVVEADESDASFLHLSPMLSVLTNIDADHMATYGHSLARLHAAFVDFIQRLPFYGRAIVCIDDAGVRAVLPQLERPLLTYGTADDAQVRAVDLLALPGGQMQFTVLRTAAGGAETVWPPLPITLNLAGEHNVRNALAAVAVAMLLALPDAAVQRALARFEGVGRRFQRHGRVPCRNGGSFELIDDYGHHPVELAAVLNAARGAFPGQRLLLAFQPHRYSRTQDCFADFVAVLGQFDALLLTEVYAAGEAPIAGADGAALAQAIRAEGRIDPVYVPDVKTLTEAIHQAAQNGDVVITAGAGSISAVSSSLQAPASVDLRPLPGRHRAGVRVESMQNSAANFSTSAGKTLGKTLGKTAVLMGGSSAERQVSWMSGSGVLKALQSQGIDAHAFDPAERDLAELKRDNFERVFIALHGRHGEDGTVQGALELLGIPYTGSGVMASAMAMDKVMSKRLMRAENLPTPAWVWLAADQQSRVDIIQVPDQLGLPLIVKPPREGSSIGISKVTGYSQMQDAVALAAQYDADVLCEAFIEGIELTCAVLGSGAEAKALPVIRIDAPDGNYDFEHKYFSNDTGYRCPSGLSAAEEAEVQRLTLAAYRLLGCRGWGRADLMQRTRDGQFFLLEMNTSPGMTSHSLVPMAARAAGMSYEALCLHLLQQASLDSTR